MKGFPIELNRKRVLGLAGALFVLFAGYLTLHRAMLRDDPRVVPVNPVLLMSPDEARQSTQRLIDENPDSAQGYRLLAQLENAAGNVVEEARWINKAIALEGDYPRGLFRLGKTFADMGDLDQALQMAERGRALDSLDADTAYLFASVLFLLGRGQEASEVYRELLERLPDSLSLLANAAHHELMLGNYSEAKVLLLRYMGFEQEPEDWSVDASHWLGAGLLAYVFAREGDSSKAQQLSNAVLELAAVRSSAAPQAFYPYRRAAWAYALNGDRRAALEHLALAVETGYWGYWEFEYDPVWDVLREDARFQALHARMKARRAALLVQLESLS